MSSATKYVTTLLFMTTTSIAANASTVSEILTFDAKLVSGSMLYSEEGVVSSETPCPECFGTIKFNNYHYDFPYGMVIGETYEGRIELIYDQPSPSGAPKLREASCILNGARCDFGDDFLPTEHEGLLGPYSDYLDFTGSDLTLSRFHFSEGTGTYNYATDYLFFYNALYYYAGVQFDLTNVVYTPPTPAPIPLPASLPLLIGGIFGLGAFRRYSVSQRPTQIR